MKNSTRFVTLTAAALLLSQCAALWAAEQPRVRAGFIERALIGRPGHTFQAKLDTGADLSSLDAIDFSVSQRNGVDQIEFTVVRTDETRVRLSAPLVRYTHVKRIGGEPSKRPVVMLDVCVGSISRRVEVTLANRKGFDYDVLIGRNFLSGFFMVDPALQRVLTLDCQE